MAQINPEELSIKQLRKLEFIYRNYYYSDTAEEQKEYEELSENPKSDPDRLNYLCNYLDDKFQEGLVECGLWDVYWYLDKIDRALKEPYSEDELEEWDDVSLKYLEGDSEPREFLTEDEPQELDLPF